VSERIPRISVIVVTYNSAACLTPTLEAALGQDYPNYEIVLLDNASRDGSLAIAREFQGERLRVIASPVNRGFAGGNNDAVAASRGEIVFLLNPDAILLGPGALDEVAAALAGPAARRGAGIIGGKLLAEDAVTLLHCGGVIDPCAHTILLGRGEEDQGQWDSPQEVDFVIGAALALPRDLWDALGGLDEDFSPAYYEDTDLCLRARRLGRRVIYWPRLAAIHRENVSTEYKSPSFWWFHHRNRLWFLVKNHSVPGILLKVIPHELRWYCSSQSRGLRRFMLRVYYHTLRRFIARRILRRRPRPFAG
jgi:GT2 family glycosyltransferase